MATESSSIRPLREVIRPVTLIEANRLSERLGVEVLLASETFQVTGSFKFRAAYHLAAQVPQGLIITASSGNFGQGLARACQILGKRCIVVMPDTSAAVKVEAVREYGGRVEFIDVRVISRQKRVQELAVQHPDGYVASAYDDPLVIEGNASLGEELAGLDRRVDGILAPIGGGGLASGILTGLRRAGSAIPVWAVEPRLANDAARSLREGRIVANDHEPETMADGVRTLSVGRHNWSILKEGLTGILEVSEEQIAVAVRELFHRVNLKAEPTGALSLAGLLSHAEEFQGQTVCCVVSGGNVDPAVYARILAGACPKTLETWFSSSSSSSFSE
jgi:threonine dehydratase